ncbi:uncharacterized protein LOC108205799 isoform X2 [Daucus carota subsp. sativus]|uniref:uncharacterized protein LOC108205799 isoform X2 n=1 Tax=Daucus carota subsp. sativus TaxID=79200 RepID=UPI0007EF7845|nr:PREDICTED: trichohyalin-like isoform X2 [Daucus carota subsp. sativus]
MSETEVKHLPVNPCCHLLQEQVSRLQGELLESTAKLNESSKARKALRKAIRLLELQNQLLNKESEEEKKRAEDREKELSSLRSEILASRQLVCLGSKGANEKVDEERGKVDAEKCSSEKMCADKEAEDKQKELATRHGWEAEVSALKSQIVLLQQGMAVQNETNVPRLFQAQLSEEHAKINQLKKLLEKERHRADSEAKKAKEAMRKASEAQKMVMTQKSRADEERRLAAIERKEATVQLEKLRAEVEFLRSNLVSETLKFEETNKKLETEKQKVIEEKQRADNEMAKAEEKSRLLEMSERHIVEEKSRSDCLSQKIEEDRHSLRKLQEEIAKYAPVTKNVKAPCGDSVENTVFRTGKLNNLPQLEVISKESGVSKLIRDCVQCRGLSKKLKEAKQKARREKKLANSEMAKAEELRKIVETFGRNAMVNRRQAEELAHELEGNRCKTDEPKNEFMSSGILINPRVNNNTNTDPRTVKLLKKELKICKMQVKHAKEVASFEKSRNLLLQQEIRRIKRECSRISDHFDSLDKCFSSQNKCDVSRERGLNLKRKFLEEEPCQITSSTPWDAYDALKHRMESTRPLLESGKDCNSESLLRGS